MATINFVTTANEVSVLLSTLRRLPTSPSSLYIDLGGTELSRADIYALGATAFSTPAPTAQSSSLSATTDISKHEPDNESPVMLKSTLECHSTPKVFFDVRNDSDALFSYFEIRLNCIHDLHLMELATCRMSRAYLNSLAECIDYDTNMSIAQRQHATHIKNQGTRRQALRAEQRRLI